MKITIERARELLGERGRRLSDEEIRQKCDAASGLARLTYDLLQREHRETTMAQPMARTSERGAA